MEDFAFLRTLLDFKDELSDYALDTEDLHLALDEFIYRVIEFDYKKMSEERA